jgi:hypothetical protein
MAERPVARDDAVTENRPPLEPPREPPVSADDADDADDHKSRDPYQPL